ncbi:S41 family peptidase [Hymenobacter norwichensis]|uniref:S41 family peptidase n=1 Tax=Hymenobacter norwichensis TaxID=223903 RepID=UPI0003B64BD9|nr:S41 family peptidase [Hymenobacter norwichensis]
MRLLILPLLLIAGSLFAQTSKPDAQPSKQVVQYLDRFQQIIKKNALYADSLEWEQLSKEVKEKSQGLATIEDCRPVIDHILNTLRNAGDKHSAFMPKGKAASWTSSTYAGKQAESRYLEKGIGYIKIPAFSSMDSSVGRTFSQGIRSQMQALATQHNLRGWVVDLRHNTGGNMHPMIDGLQPLLKEETYGYFIFPRRKKEIQLRIRSGKGTKQGVGVAAITQPNVAVLIDSLTGSSGEMVAIAFKGRDNTRFFGQPSAGYTTTNGTYKLSDGAYLFLATGYMADKNRHTYLPTIVPDVVVEYAPQGAQDMTIEAASKWLVEAK